MALTKAQVREILSAAGVASDKMDDAVAKIIDGHVTSINALREERDALKADAEKLPGVQKELDDLKKTMENSGDAEKKYQDEHTAFERFKAEVQAEKDAATKKSLYRKLLEDLHVDGKRFEAILKLTDLSKLKVTKEGVLDGVDALKEAAKKEWADFIVTDKVEPGKVETPPASNGAGAKTESRAAQLQAQYNASHYGEIKKN